MRILLAAPVIIGLTIVSAAAAAGVDQTKAISIIAEHGFSTISPLTRDSNGVWHGTAVKNGDKVQVTVEANGKLTEKSG